MTANVDTPERRVTRLAAFSEEELLQELRRRLATQGLTVRVAVPWGNNVNTKETT